MDKVLAYTKGISKHQKAERAVRVVKADLESLGFTVVEPNDISANGADLMAMKDKVGFRIEVKAAFLSKRSWRIKRVTRSNDDILAVVFPNGRVHYEPMSQHIAAHAGKDRGLTMIARIHGC